MKRLLFLFLFTLPLPLLGDDLPQEIPRPASDAYRHPAQVPFVQRPAGINSNYRKITVSPKMLPDPLLRYRVNTFASEQETGNAYPLFVAALKEYNKHADGTRIAHYRSEAYRSLDSDKEEDQRTMGYLLFRAFPLYSHWSRDMWTEITAEDEARLYQRLDGVYRLMEKASKKTYFDWSDEYKFAGIATTLEPLQEARELSRYLSGKANWEIRNGNYVDAIRTIRVGLAHAEHILESRPPGFLVGMLVGLALKQMMFDQLFLLSAQPDAPNLYPALMQLTVSQKHWLDAIRSETLWLIPQYNDDRFWDTLDSLSPEQAQSILDEFALLFQSVESTSEEPEKNRLPLTRTAICVASYQPAKQRLLQKGLSEEAIEAFSTYQIVVPFILEEIKRTYDLLSVEASMPVANTPAAFNFDEHVMNLSRNPRSSADNLLALITPATRAARTAFTRQTQTLDLLKIVEAIRYFSALHGKLPASLDEITELAVPKMCPITATPYRYSVSGNTAVIDYSMYDRDHRDKSRLEIVLE